MSLAIKEVPLEVIWQVRQEVMYPELSIQEVKLADDEAGRHLGLFADGSLRSIISLFEKEKSLQFRKFATQVAYQGQGFGKELLRHVFEQAKAGGIATIWCNARTSAAGMYQQFGMQPFGDTWQQHGHQFVKMQITL